jgi:hypothetical protein
MEFQSHLVVTSQRINKKFGAPTPTCFVYKQVNYNNFAAGITKGGSITVQLTSCLTGLD